MSDNKKILLNSSNDQTAQTHLIYAACGFDQRRRAVLGRIASSAIVLSSPALLAGCSPGPIKMTAFDSIPSAIKTLTNLKSQPMIKNGKWDLAHTLHHAAQSVEFSMKGFPSHKPDWFKSTFGQAAFAMYSSRGSMSHTLDEPIPGAPDIAQGQPLSEAVDHIVTALKTFELYQGVLFQHFAYGELNKTDYTRAHLLHLADHWREVVA